MNADYQQWLQSLRPGDDVAYSSGTPGLWTVTAITRITGDKIHTEHWTFYTDTGKCTECCRPGRPRLLVKPDSDIRQKHRRMVMLTMIQRCKWNLMEDDELERVVKVIEQAGEV